MSRLLVLFFAAAACAMPRAQHQEMPPPRAKPIKDPARRLEFPGLSILPPQGAGWLLAPPLPAFETAPLSTIAAFGRQTAQGPANSPQAMHTAGAHVMTEDLGERRFAGPAEYAAFERERTDEAVGKLVSARHRLLSSHFEPDPAGGLCLKFDQAVEDTGVPQFPGVPFILRTKGTRCVLPKWPRYAVHVFYNERSAQGVPRFQIDNEVEPFLRGVLLTGERPVHVSTIAVGLSAQGVIPHDGAIWVAWGDDGVARIDPGTNQVRQIKVGRDPVGIAAGPEGIWVANRQDGTIARIEPSGSGVAATIAVGGKPLLLIDAFASLWVADQASTDVVRVDPKTGRVTRIPVREHPAALVEADGAVFAASFDEGTVVRVDPRSHEVKGPVALCGGPGAGTLAEGDLWFACQHDGTIVRLDPKTMTAKATIPLGARPSGIASGEGVVWVTLYDEFLVVRIDPRSNRQSGEGIPVGPRPVLACWGFGALWVTNAWGSDLSRIDL